MDIFLASNNPHKLAEFSGMFQESGLEVNLWSAQAIGGMPEVEENGTSFEENSLLKARALFDVSPATAWFLADDSGLEVQALDGAPGVLSARYAGKDASDEKNVSRLLAELENTPEDQRKASFACSLTLLDPEGEPHVFNGQCHGLIIREPRGNQGFGYDPVFVPEGYDLTFAELGEPVKHQLSHRARAFQALLKTWPALPRQFQSD